MRGRGRTRARGPEGAGDMARDAAVQREGGEDPAPALLAPTRTPHEGGGATRHQNTEAAARANYLPGFAACSVRCRILWEGEAARRRSWAWRWLGQDSEEQAGTHEPHHIFTNCPKISLLPPKVHTPPASPSVGSPIGQGRPWGVQQPHRDSLSVQFSVVCFDWWVGFGVGWDIGWATHPPSHPQTP